MFDRKSPKVLATATMKIIYQVSRTSSPMGVALLPMSAWHSSMILEVWLLPGPLYLLISFLHLLGSGQPPSDCRLALCLPYVPKNGWFVVENPIEMDDLGATPFLGNLHICGYHLFLGHPNWYGFMLCWKSGGNDPNRHAAQDLNPLYSGWFRQLLLICQL